MKPYPGRVLILSAIIGGSNHNETQMRFYRPHVSFRLKHWDIAVIAPNSLVKHG